MGRTVGRHPYALVNAYLLPVDYLGYEIEDSNDWDDMIKGLQSHIYHVWPSMRPATRWEGREGRVIAENDLAMVVLYEYCGLACLSLVPLDDDHPALAESWCNRVAAKFEREFASLRHVATFGNGEALYERAGAAE